MSPSNTWRAVPWLTSTKGNRGPAAGLTERSLWKFQEALPSPAVPWRVGLPERLHPKVPKRQALDPGEQLRRFSPVPFLEGAMPGLFLKQDAPQVVL